MPYIICVSRPGCLPEQEPFAVADLGEAKDHAASIAVEANTSLRHVGQAHTLPEEGGRIGPLPDGYVIEVRRVDWLELAASMAQRFIGQPPDVILHAYNEGTRR
jgi:hypothetical protein